jgi:hypothetical protein
VASPPTPTDIRAWSKLDLDREGYAEGEDALLSVQLERAVAYLGYVTGRTYDQAQTDQFPMAKTMLDQAVQMRTEQVILSLSDDALSSVGDIDTIASFSAGPYSETRKDTTDNKRTALNPWPPLNDLLWLLLGLMPGETNDAVLDRYDYWRALLSGINAPAWQVVEVDWGRGLGLNDWPSPVYHGLTAAGWPGLAGPVPG